MRIRSALSCCAILALLGGCAAPTAITTSSGFLSDYSQLQADEGGKSASYTAEGFDLKKYGKITFAPVKVHLSQKLLDETTLEPAQQEELATFIAEKLNSAFSREFHGQGTGDLKIRGAVSGVSSSSEELSVYQYLPITLAVTAAMEAGGVRDKKLVIFFEVEAVDGDSGEVVAARVRGADLGQVTAGKLKDDPVAAIEPQLQEWVEKLAADFASRLK